jgi:hypothetical protein
MIARLARILVKANLGIHRLHARFSSSVASKPADNLDGHVTTSMRTASRFALTAFILSSFVGIIAPAGLTAQTGAPEILRIYPTGGPEGTRVQITGKNLAELSSVSFGSTPATFKSISDDQILALVPHKTSTASITVATPRGRASSPFPFVVLNDPRIPDEVSYKAGYVNPAPPPAGFSSAMLWGIAIADTRVAGFASATVEVASMRLTCRADGKDIILNDDRGNVRGGLYSRNPWFGDNRAEPLSLIYDPANHAAVLRVGQRPDRVWHFWAASPRAPLPSGELEGCTAKARVRISPGALLQLGMDYWRNPTVAFGQGGNNREAGASNWYFPSDQWQDAVFTDIGGPL